MITIDDTEMTELVGGTQICWVGFSEGGFAFLPDDLARYFTCF